MPPRARVAIIGLNYSPEQTGIAPYTAGLAHKLNEEFDVTVITGVPHYPRWRRIPFSESEDRQHRHKVVRVPHIVPRTNGMMGRLALELSFTIATFFVKLRNPKFAIFVTPSLISSYLGLLRIKLLRSGTKTFLWVQDLYGLGSAEIFGKRNLSTWILNAIERHAFLLANEIVVIHESFKNHLVENMEIDPNKIVVLKNWSHFNYQPSKSRSETLQAFGLRDFPTVMHTGNMGMKQGLEHAIDAAVASQAYQLVLVGDGACKRDLTIRAMGHSNIVFIPPVDEYELSNLLSCADVLLVQEAKGVGQMAVPSKLTTYMTTGKPILGATEPDSNSAIEILQSGAGIIVPSGDTFKMNESLEFLFSNSAMTSALGAAGLNFAATHYSQNLNLQTFEALLKR